jgi:PBP1b-binding outer membrane lipoprotein LpoB
MSRTVAIICLALTVGACSQESQEASATNKCAADLFSPYNPKDLKQCVPVCIKCENGTTTTCTTSCTLKGAK